MRSRRSPQSPCAMSLSASSFTEGRRGGTAGISRGSGGRRGRGRRTSTRSRSRPGSRRSTGKVGIVAVMDRDEKLLATAEVHGEMLESLRARRRGSRAKRRDVSDGGRC